MDKKGQVGLDTAKSVMLILLFVGVIGFVGIVMLASLTSTPVARTSGSGSIASQTTNVTHDLTDIVAGFRDCALTVTNVTTFNDSTRSIDSGNYTVSGCQMRYTALEFAYNGTDWNITGTYTFNDFATTSQNITEGTRDFFSNASTWFALLSVVVIIFIIAIIIFAVNRFGGNSASVR